MRITKEQYEQLPDFMKSMFVKSDDGGYISKEAEDNGALKRAKDRERDAKKEAQKRAKELEDELQAYRDKEEKEKDDKAKKEGDIEAFNKKWQKKYDEDIAKKDAEIANLNSEVSSLVIDTQARSLAEAISTVPDLMVDVLKKRLSLDRENGKPIARVLDANGEPTPMTLEELGAEFQNNEKYSAIMVASKASGGAKSSDPDGLPASGGSDSKPTRFSDMSFAQKKAMLEREIKSKE